MIPKQREIIKKNITHYRTKVGIPKAKLADEINVTRGAVGFYENLERVDVPSIENLFKISDVLGISVMHLLFEDFDGSFVKRIPVVGRIPKKGDQAKIIEDSPKPKTYIDFPINGSESLDNLKAYCVDDDSMNMIIPVGSRVVLSNSNDSISNLIAGKIYLLHTGDGGYCLRMFEPISGHPQFAPKTTSPDHGIVSPSDCKVIGRIIYQAANL